MDNNLPNLSKNKKFLTVAALIFTTLIISTIIAGLSISFNKSGSASKDSTLKSAADLGIEKILCPSVKEFCEKGKSIVKDGEYLGFGTPLPSDSQSFAVFSGKLSSRSTQTEKGQLITLTLISESGNLKAIYQYLGNPPAEILTYEGARLQFMGGVMPEYGVTLIFSLVSTLGGSETKVELTPQDFK